MNHSVIVYWIYTGYMGRNPDNILEHCFPDKIDWVSWLIYNCGYITKTRNINSF